MSQVASSLSYSNSPDAGRASRLSARPATLTRLGLRAGAALGYEIRKSLAIKKFPCFHSRSPMAVTLNQLSTFLAVAREGSVSAAAERLYVTQPSISAAV